MLLVFELLSKWGKVSCNLMFNLLFGVFAHFYLLIVPASYHFCILVIEVLKWADKTPLLYIKKNIFGKRA